MKTIDFLGPKINFTVDGHRRYKSSLGAIATIFIAMAAIAVIISLGIDIFKRQNPISIFSKQYIDYPVKEIKDFVFMMSPMLRAAGAIQDIDRKLRVYFEYVDADSKRTKLVSNITKHELVRCKTNSKMFEEHSANLTQMFLGNGENYFCLPDEWGAAKFEGKFGSQKYKYINFKVEFCNNATMNDTCYSKETIQQELDLMYLHFVYLDYYIDIEDFEVPTKKIYSGDVMQGSSYSSRTDEYQFKLLDINTDLGWIFYDGDMNSIFQLDSKQSTSTPNDNPNSFFLVRTSLIKLKDIYKRRYIKLQEILANTGGIIKFFLFISSYFNNFFIEIDMVETLFFKIKSKFELQQKLKITNESGITEIIPQQMDTSNLRMIEKPKFQEMQPRKCFEKIFYICLRKNSNKINLESIKTKMLKQLEFLKYLKRANITKILGEHLTKSDVIKENATKNKNVINEIDQIPNSYYQHNKFKVENLNKLNKDKIKSLSKVDDLNLNKINK